MSVLRRSDILRGAAVECERFGIDFRGGAPAENIFREMIRESRPVQINSLSGVEVATQRLVFDHGGVLIAVMADRSAITTSGSGWFATAPCWMPSVFAATIEGCGEACDGAWWAGGGRTGQFGQS
jgi:hypothetical protein